MPGLCKGYDTVRAFLMHGLDIKNGERVRDARALHMCVWLKGNIHGKKYILKAELRNL